MDDYWTSAEALERKRRDRWLRIARAIVDQEPRRKGRAGRSQAIAFRNAVREDIALQQRDWPKPRAPLALDFDFVAVAREPPALWRLPKHHLDLLGATSAPSRDPGPVLYNDDRQVKLLFARLARTERPGAPGRIYLEARTRTSALADMELANELLDGDADELEGDTRWAEADPWEVMDVGYEGLPPAVVPVLQFHDKSGYQAMLLGSNDRLVRGVFFRAARWLLTGVDPGIRRLQRLGVTGQPAVEDLVGKIAETKARERDLLWSTIRIELPPLPLQHGDGDIFRERVRLAFRAFVKEHPDLQPLIVPLRVTVLVIPPKRRASTGKDLDNLLIEIMAIMEAELKPHPEPWLLAPDVVVPGAELGGVTGSALVDRSRKRRTINGTWAYQVLELHRQSGDDDQGALVVVPGLGWNRTSIWGEAESFVEKRLAELADEDA